MSMTIEEAMEIILDLARNAMIEEPDTIGNTELKAIANEQGEAEEKVWEHLEYIRANPPEIDF